MNVPVLQVEVTQAQQVAAAAEVARVAAVIAMETSAQMATTT
jgi:hypothetical protein